MKNYLFLGLLALLTGCNHNQYIYKAPMIHSQPFEARGDVFVAFGVNQLPGVQLGYAFHEHWGVLGGVHGEKLGTVNRNYYSPDRSTLIAEIPLEHSRNGLEIGLIHFNQLSNLWRWEVQAEFGRLDHKLDGKIPDAYASAPFDGPEMLTPTYNRLYLQPALGMQKEHFGWSVGFRAQQIRYLPEMVGIPFNDLVLEPFVQLKGGFDHVKASFHMGTTHAIQNGAARYYAIHLGLGIQLQLNALTLLGKN